MLVNHLQKLFEDHRIVFWRDINGEYAEIQAALDLPGVEIVSVRNNEFALKRRMLHLKPKTKFLVCQTDAAPADIDNWLLDLELGNAHFSADKISLVMQGFGFESAELRTVIQEHPSFFANAKRVEVLKASLQQSDDATVIRAKMSAALLKSGIRIADITGALLRENALGKDEGFRALSAYGLEAFHWRGVKSIYGYDSPAPTIDDFVLWVFQRAMEHFAADTPGRYRNIQLDFGQLRFDTRYADTYVSLANRVARDLSVRARLADVDFREVLDEDWFDEYDRVVIRALAAGVAERDLSPQEVTDVIRRRSSSIWIRTFAPLYRAIAAASQLFTAIDALPASIGSFDEGLSAYSREWFRIDQRYREFCHAERSTEHGGVLDALAKKVEAVYANDYLRPQSTAWQQQVDTLEKWRSSIVPSQSRFFEDTVAPIIRGGRTKAVVIISDALRYEVADELGARLRREDRFDAELKPMLGVVPSYTQLGMAALLPHTTLAHSGDKDLVLADGKPTAGTASRAKILASVSGTARTAEDFRALGREEARDLVRDHQVIYLYHNLIDATGDKPVTEKQVFDAAERTLVELVDLVKKLAGANARNVIITADHGFLYQQAGLDEAGFLSVGPHADEILFKARRYMLGRGFKTDPAFITFTPAQLGLQGDIEVQMPKANHRLRLKGSGSRFVHGGASLQEVVVPLLVVKKADKSDVRKVAVVIHPESDVITTGQIAVRLFQSEPVTEKVQPRTLRAGLYVGEILISNQVEVTCANTSPEVRDRYEIAKLLLAEAANDHNNRLVELRLEEPISNTNQWRTYAKVSYTLRRSFMTDF